MTHQRNSALSALSAQLDNLIETAHATAVSADYHNKSYKAHSRFDYPDHDDKNSCIAAKRGYKLRPVFPPKIHIY
ncbi:MAG: hypothetical protein ACSLEL_05640 [Candidatus Malihini olakiniferum]